MLHSETYASVHGKLLSFSRGHSISHSLHLSHQQVKIMALGPNLDGETPERSSIRRNQAGGVQRGNELASHSLSSAFTALTSLHCLTALPHHPKPRHGTQSRKESIGRFQAWAAPRAQRRGLGSFRDKTPIVGSVSNGEPLLDGGFKGDHKQTNQLWGYFDTNSFVATCFLVSERLVRISIPDPSLAEGTGHREGSKLRNHNTSQTRGFSVE